MPSFLEERCVGLENGLENDLENGLDDGLGNNNAASLNKSQESYEAPKTGALLSRNNPVYYYGYKDVARLIIFVVIPFISLVYLYARIVLEIRRVKKMNSHAHGANHLKAHQVASLLEPST